MAEYISAQEDELNILFDKLSKTITTFTTLSREQAEKAIIETNAKIKDGENILEKLENFIKDNENKIPHEEIVEYNKKINNYKNDFKNIVNKFNVTQSTYINKKAETALIDDIEISINHNKTDLIDDDMSKKKVEETSKKGEPTFKIGNIQNISNNGNNLDFGKNIDNISGINNNTVSDEVFRTMNLKSSKKKRKLYCALLIILSVIIISFILILILFTQKSKK
jgi:hypothetical protein